MYNFELFFHADRHENKETNRKSFDVKCDNSQACKKWPRNGMSQFFKKFYYWLLISFDFLILWLSILKDLLTLTLQLQQLKHYIFTSSFTVQIVNILILLFWNLYFVDKLRHCLLNLKGHLKIIKNCNHVIIIIALDTNVITNNFFIIISILCIIVKLTELHELTLIASFLFLLTLKVHMGKLKKLQLIFLLSERKASHFDLEESNVRLLLAFWLALNSLHVL